MTERPSPLEGTPQRMIEKYIIPREQTSLQALAKTERINFLPSNEPTLGAFTEKVVESIENYWDTKTHLFYLVGLPNAGKSHFKREIIAHTELVQERLFLEDKKITIRQYSWDVVEEILVDENIITPKDKNKPYEPAELDVTNVYFNTGLASTVRKDKNIEIARQQLKESLIDTGLLKPRPGETEKKLMARIESAYIKILDQFSIRPENLSEKGLVLFIEKPDLTAYQYPDGRWEETERKYSSQTLDHLMHAVPPYNGINRDDLYVAAIGCVGGPSMKIFGTYRSQLQKILAGPAPLKTANELNREFGLPLFRNTDEVREHARGATPAQTAEAKLAMQELVQKLLVQHEESFLTNLPYSLKLFLFGLYEVGFDSTLLRFIRESTKNNFPEELKAWDELLEQVNEVREIVEGFSNGNGNGNGTEHKFSNGEMPFARMMSICFNLAGAAILERNLDKPDVKIVLYNNPSLRSLRKR